MTQIPQRASLVSQVAEIVRRDIRRGEWGDFLPGELELCDRLKVSRPTLRTALDLLKREGLIEVSQGRRRRIVTHKRLRSAPRESKVVGALASIPYHTLSSFSLFILNELQTHLNDAGYRLEVHAHARFGHPHPAHALESLAEQLRPAAWVLIGPTNAVQSWFAGRRFPVFVLGASDKEHNLPCLGVDYRAITRHAVGMYLNRGHQRVALVIPEAPDRKADNPTAVGFSEGFASVRTNPSIHPTLVTHNATVDGIRAALTAMLRQKMPPTGLLVSRPKHALSVMSHLMNSGIHIPNVMSVLSLGHDPILDEMTPSMARYVINWEAYSRRAARLAMQMVTQGTLPSRQILVTAQFQDGATLRNLSHTV